MDSFSSQIKSTALNMGYEKCGIIKISDMAGYEEKLNERVKRMPESKPFYERMYRFTHLQETYPWAKSIVVCISPYGKYHVPENLQGLIGKAYLVDSRIDEQSKELQASLKFEEYMQGLGLKTEAERKFGITALRWAAVKAGLGVVRRNNFFYTKSGSWIHLEAWLIDKELELIEKPTVKECPENCNRCVTSCPTASLARPYTMSPTACISFLTTFGGRDLPHEKYNGQIGGWVYGCDVCQDVCPMNKNRWSGTEEFPSLEELSQHISLEKIIRMDYSFLEEVMQAKFWYINKEDVWKWKVNAINAMVNDYQEKYKKYIVAARKDSHEKVREMARWAIEKMNLST
jgi:epoxyqueuosine reductase